MAQQLYTATALGKILNLSGVHVGRLAREGTLTRRPDGKYPTAAITQYIEALRERGRDRSKYAEQIAAEKVANSGARTTSRRGFTLRWRC
jgi:hypothetical protein